MHFNDKSLVYGLKLTFVLAFPFIYCNYCFVLPASCTPHCTFVGVCFQVISTNWPVISSTRKHASRLDKFTLHCKSRIQKIINEIKKFYSSRAALKGDNSLVNFLCEMCFCIFLEKLLSQETTQEM